MIQGEPIIAPPFSSVKTLKIKDDNINKNPIEEQTFCEVQDFLYLKYNDGQFNPKIVRNFEE